VRDPSRKETNIVEFLWNTGDSESTRSIGYMVGVVLIQILREQTEHWTVKCAHSVLNWTEERQ
jgi:hypothetical protein